MSGEQYEKWLPTSIADYAKEHTIGGRWTAEEALRRSREEFDSLLPQGLATPNHRLYSILRLPDRKPAGVLWVQVEGAPKQTSFIYNIEIFKPFRRRGYARQAMQLLEQEVRRLGAQTVRLHVFGHNRAARSLYEQLGYVATNIQMRKRLRPASTRARTIRRSAAARGTRRNIRSG